MRQVIVIVNPPLPGLYGVYCTGGLSLVVQARGLYVVMHECIISGSASPRAVCGYCTGGLSLVVQARGLYVVMHECIISGSASPRAVCGYARVDYLW